MTIACLMNNYLSEDNFWCHVVCFSRPFPRRFVLKSFGRRKFEFFLQLSTSRISNSWCLNRQCSRISFCFRDSVTMHFKGRKREQLAGGVKTWRKRMLVSINWLVLRQTWLLICSMSHPIKKPVFWCHWKLNFTS